MAHNLARRNGKDAMFCVGDRDAAWHGLGQRVGQATTWEQAMELALLDWEVVKEPLYDKNGRELATFGIFRKDDERAFFGNVGSVYTPIQNREAFQFVDTLLETNQGAHYESAGALGEGEQIWCMARVPAADFEVVKGDEHQAYLLFTTSHDGSGAATCKLTTVRVVCQNTLNLALHHANHGTALRIRHTADAGKKLAYAQTMMKGVTQDAGELERKLKALAERKLTKETMKVIFAELWPEPKDKTTPGGLAADTRRNNVLADVLKLYEVNDKMRFGQVSGTAYNLLNAVTEWTDHLRGGRPNPRQDETQARQEAAMFGTGSDFKVKALDVILDATGGAPSILNAVAANTR